MIRRFVVAKAYSGEWLVMGRRLGLPGHEPIANVRVGDIEMELYSGFDLTKKQKLNMAAKALENLAGRMP